MRTKLRGKVTLLFMMLGMLLAVPAVALAADIVVPDGDLVTLGNQAGTATNPINLGPVKGGVALTKHVSFELQCFSNNNHVDNTQGVDINFMLQGSPGGATFLPPGLSASATSAHIGATSGTDLGVPTSWPDDGQNCPATATTVPDNGNSTVTITPPSSEGTYDFQISYKTSVSPAGNQDTQALQGNGVVVVFYRLTVDNTAPTVTAFSPTDPPAPPFTTPITTDVTATFSEAMNAATLDDAEGDGNFTLKKTSDNSLVGAVVSYNATDKKATLNPNADLAYNTQYTATVTTGATDVAGNALDQDGAAGTQNAKTWTFTTEPPPNSAPVANDVSATTNEDNSTTITLSGSDEDGDDLTFEITDQPDNGQLGPIVPVNNTSATVTYTPNQNYNGLDSFKYRANDGTVNSAEVTVSITVNPVNDEPSFTGSGDVMVNEDSGAYSAAWATGISAGPADENGQTVSFNVSNTNSALFSSQPAISNSGVLTFTPAANAFGTSQVTVFAQDNGGTLSGGDNTSASQTFTITVTGVNDEPSFTKGADQTVNEDAGAQTVNAWATGISAGPNESGQTLTFDVTNDNNALFSSQPSVSSTGTLTYTPAANANGEAEVSVTLKDNGGTANSGDDTSATQTFTITVNAVNDEPSFTKGADENVLEDSGTAGAHSVSGWATAISAGPNESGQTLTFDVTNDNISLFTAAGQPKVAANGTLTYTLAANANGTANVDVTLKDNGGTANGGDDTSATQSFQINVTAVNDAPSFSLLPANPNQKVLANATGSVDNFAGNFSPGPPNESGQALLRYVVTITNTNNTNLFSEQPAIDNTGKLTYKLAQDAVGTATVSVKVQDDGGTANNGVDLSAEKTFTIDVNYGWSGFLQPINMTAHQTGADISTFKAGSTVPAKFQLKDANGNIIQPASAPVWVTPLKGSATNQAVDEDLYSLAATTGGTYRYDATAQQWIYNWSTKGLTSGCYYRIGVTLPDGETHYQNISLR